LGESGQSQWDRPRELLGSLRAVSDTWAVVSPRHPRRPRCLPTGDPLKLVEQLILGRLRPQESVGDRPDECVQIRSRHSLWVLRDLDESLRLQVRPDERVDRGRYPLEECTVKTVEGLLSGICVGSFTVEHLSKRKV